MYSTRRKDVAMPKAQSRVERWSGSGPLMTKRKEFKIFPTLGPIRGDPLSVKGVGTATLGHLFVLF